MLNFKTKLSYGVGALGKDLACSIVFVYVMYYFTDVIGLDPLFVGTLMFIARFWDAINDTFMGVVVDNTRSRFGKFRPWILIGTVINAVTVIFLFTKPNLTSSAQAYYFVAMYIIWGMTYTIMDIPYWSMLPSLSNSVEERNKIAIIPRIFASIAWLFMGTFGLQTIKKLGNVGDLGGVEKIAAEATGFRNFAIIIAIVFIISAIITVVNVKEIPIVGEETKEKVTFKKALQIIGKNDQLIAFIGIVLSFNLITQLAGGVAIYYFKYAVGGENLFAVFQGFSGLAEISGLLLFPILARSMSRTKIYAISCSLPILGLSLLVGTGLIMPKAAELVAVSGIIFKLGAGMALGVSTVMLADVVDYGEYKLRSRNESIIFSIQTMLVKFASAISGYIIGIGLTMVGYVPNVPQSTGTVFGLRMLMSTIPAGLAILSFIIFVRYFKIKGTYHRKMLNKLNERREKACI